MRNAWAQGLPHHKVPVRELTVLLHLPSQGAQKMGQNPTVSFQCWIWLLVYNTILKSMYSRCYHNVIIIDGDYSIWLNRVVTSWYDHNSQCTVCVLAMKNRLNGANFPFIWSIPDDNRNVFKLMVFGNLGLRAGRLRCILEIWDSHLHPINVNFAIL